MFKNRVRAVTSILLQLCLAGTCVAFGAQTEFKQRPQLTDSPYLLGPEDELSIQVADLDQFAGKTFRIDPLGIVHLPVAGDVQAAGMTSVELQQRLADHLRTLLKRPQVAVNVVSYHSQPVAVLGAVSQPGLHQMQGPSRLIEMLASAGGVRADAGNTLRITRQKESGKLPIAGAKVAPDGLFSSAEINLAELTRGRRPEENIFLRAHDVISVDKADLVYVVGEVKKAGGFTLAARENITILQALALAEGFTQTASKSAKVLRKNPEGDQRSQIPINFKRIIAGKAPDMVLRPDDILFVPNNVLRGVALRAAEAAVQVGTGLVIWRR